MNEQKQAHRLESSDTIRLDRREIERLLAEHGDTLKSADDDAPREPAGKP